MKKIQKSLFENKNNWKTKKLAFPKATIRVGSLFSGIGAFEQALKILKLKTKIVFACDNDVFAKKSFLSNYKMSDKNCANQLLFIIPPSTLIILGLDPSFLIASNKS